MDGGFFDPTASVVFELQKRNELAEKCISHYTTRHKAIDIAIGIVGIIPGAALPCLMAAIAAQGPVIYQPMARKLQQIYLAPPNELGDIQTDVVPVQVFFNGGLDIAADFGVDFLKEIAWEIALEAGAGALAGTLIPFVGGVIGAGLDMYIAHKMTKRVGRMAALYFQRGARWKNGNRKETYEEAKNMDGDLNSIYRNNPGIRASLLSKIATSIKMVGRYMNNDQIREMLQSQGVPNDLIDEALRPA